MTIAVNVPMFDTMTDIARAVSIASGVQPPTDPTEFVWAYQMVVDAAIAWMLPPYVAEVAWELIEAGDVHLPSFRAGTDNAAITDANE